MSENNNIAVHALPKKKRKRLIDDYLKQQQKDNAQATVDAEAENDGEQQHHHQHKSNKHKKRREDPSEGGSSTIDYSTTTTTTSAPSTILNSTLVARLERLQATERILVPSTKASQQDRDDITRLVQRWSHAKNKGLLENDLYELIKDYYPTSDQKVLLDEAITLFLILYPNKAEVVLSPIAKCLSTTSRDAHGNRVSQLRYNKKAPPFYSIFNLFSNLGTEADFEVSITRTSCKEILRFFAERIPTQQRRKQQEHIKPWLLDCLLGAPKQLKKYYVLYLLEQCFASSSTSPSSVGKDDDLSIVVDKQLRIDLIAEHLSDLIHIEEGLQQKQSQINNASNSENNNNNNHNNPSQNIGSSTLAHVWTPTIITFAYKQRLLGRRFPLFPFNSIISVYFSKPPSTIFTHKLINQLISYLLDNKQFYIVPLIIELLDLLSSTLANSTNTSWLQTHFIQPIFASLSSPASIDSALKSANGEKLLSYIFTSAILSNILFGPNTTTIPKLECEKIENMGTKTLIMTRERERLKGFGSFLSLLSKVEEETQRLIINAWENIWNGGRNVIPDMDWDVGSEIVECDRLLALLYLNDPLTDQPTTLIENMSERLFKAYLLRKRNQDASIYLYEEILTFILLRSDNDVRCFRPVCNSHSISSSTQLFLIFVQILSLDPDQSFLSKIQWFIGKIISNLPLSIKSIVHSSVGLFSPAMQVVRVLGESVRKTQDESRGFILAAIAAPQCLISFFALLRCCNVESKVKEEIILLLRFLIDENDSSLSTKWWCNSEHLDAILHVLQDEAHLVSQAALGYVNHLIKRFEFATIALPALLKSLFIKIDKSYSCQVDTIEQAIKSIVAKYPEKREIVTNAFELHLFSNRANSKIVSILQRLGPMLDFNKRRELERIVLDEICLNSKSSQIPQLQLLVTQMLHSGGADNDITIPDVSSTLRSPSKTVRELGKLIMESSTDNRTSIESLYDI